MWARVAHQNYFILFLSFKQFKGGGEYLINIPDVITWEDECYENAGDVSDKIIARGARRNF